MKSPVLVVFRVAIERRPTPLLNYLLLLSPEQVLRDLVRGRHIIVL